ncbi:unnamed protein product [Caretta caretta]
MGIQRPELHSDRRLARVPLLTKTKQQTATLPLPAHFPLRVHALLPGVPTACPSREELGEWPVQSGVVPKG